MIINEGMKDFLILILLSPHYLYYSAGSCCSCALLVYPFQEVLSSQYFESNSMNLIVRDS